MPTALAILLALCCAPQDCADFQKLVGQTYGFRPSKLTHDEQEKKSAAMDVFWKKVKASPKTLVPCLREALEDAQADAWFRIDGSALLVEADPTQASKALQARLWGAADLDDLRPQAWMATLTALGAEGLDISEGARRWMRAPVVFAIAKHALDVNLRDGARFLVGSMDEAQALAVLDPIAADPKNPAREVALDVIACLATPEALRALKRIGLEGCEEKTRKALAPLLAKPGLMQKRGPGPRASRTKLLAAFKDFLVDKPDKLHECMQLAQSKSNEHWPEEFAGALKDEDLPLLRQVRRKRMSYLSDEALDDYSIYSGILMTLVWKPEYVQ